MKLEELRLLLEEIVDPTINMTLKESEGIKHLGYDEDKDLITLIVGIGELGGKNETILRRNVAKVVKIDAKFKGLRLQIEESKVYNSITRSKVKFIGIISGKGGVGKSNIACNIAYRLHKKGFKVGIIDADIYGSSVPSILDIEHKHPSYTPDNKIIPLVKDGIEVISTEFFTDVSQPVIWRGGMLNSMLSHFFYDTSWQPNIDYVIIDFPPGTGDVTLDVKNIVPQAKMLLVTTPNIEASGVAVKAGLAMKNLNHEVLGVIENMSYYINPVNNEKEYIFGKGGGNLLTEKLGCELIAQLEISRPIHHHDLYELDENNGRLFDFICDYIVFKTNE